jgi:hypothetical protein
LIFIYNKWHILFAPTNVYSYHTGVAHGISQRDYFKGRRNENDERNCRFFCVCPVLAASQAWAQTTSARGQRRAATT